MQQRTDVRKEAYGRAFVEKNFALKIYRFEGVSHNWSLQTELFRQAGNYVKLSIRSTPEAVRRDIPGC